MRKFKTLGDAIALAEFAHRGQVDKIGLPYIDHPKRVLDQVKAQGAPPCVQMAAILHDVTEDTAFTPQMLIDLGFPESVVKIVVLLDRDLSKVEYNKVLEVFKEHHPGKEHLTVDEYYYSNIAADDGARMVKLADIEDNLSPWRLAYLEEATQTRLLKKYSRARSLLVKRT